METSLGTSFTELLVRDYFFSDRYLMGQESGEILLQWEVFNDGLKQFWQMAEDQAYHNSPAMREEEQWVLSEDDKWPFSFVSLCETFKLEPESVHRALLSWKSKQGVAEQEGRKKPLRSFPQI